MGSSTSRSTRAASTAQAAQSCSMLFTACSTTTNAPLYATSCSPTSCWGTTTAGSPFEKVAGTRVHGLCGSSSLRHCLHFFSAEHAYLGDRAFLSTQIYDATGIPISALQGRALSSFSVDTRLGWAWWRKATREEDVAYAIMGLFDVHIPLFDGEGMMKALERLIEEMVCRLFRTHYASRYRCRRRDMELYTS
jgi:hypothetical protein